MRFEILGLTEGGGPDAMDNAFPASIYVLLALISTTAVQYSNWTRSGDLTLI